ncbi:hypothetical protein [Streptomyces sp. NPDC002588]|uniref:hypothetical protein n=1 Tax=Streptomyces sp. NPDC002588 TaxID=3154419 RepID=UPI0033185A3C
MRGEVVAGGAGRRAGAAVRRGVAEVSEVTRGRPHALETEGGRHGRPDSPEKTSRTGHPLREDPET